MTQPIIRIAAALLIGADGKLMLVRKRGTTAFMQPGGKIESGEAPVDALVRELEEELGLLIPRTAPRPLGQFSAPSANEPGYTVEAEMFRVTTTQQVRPAAEIEEAIWVDPGAAAALELAPLTRDHILPLTARCATAKLPPDTVEHAEMIGRNAAIRPISTLDRGLPGRANSLQIHDLLFPTAAFGRRPKNN